MTYDTLTPELKTIFTHIREAITLLEDEGLSSESEYLEMTVDHIKEQLDFE